ncbi:CcdB family protein [Citrifermentans bremense]|uniref:CcdB family protein n=1 Tax=Citrifermentans bremense TaxID=60035 RepID=UPI000408659D|nr:CcdB family protein [Citrifermentans bremense]
MAQFDVYRNGNPRTRDKIPYLLDVQAELLASLATRVVVPLFTVSAMGKPVRHLTPRFSIENRDVVMSTAQLAGIDQQVLGEKVGSLAERREEIIAALDFLFTGF